MIKKLFCASLGSLIVSTYGCSSMFGTNSANEVKAIEANCKAQFEQSDYDLIRGKIELYPTSEGPSLLLDNSRNKVSSVEKPVLKKFISLFSTCRGESANALYVQYPSLGVRSIDQTNLEIKLLERLYHGDLTWGEYTDRRYDIMNRRASFETQRAEREVNNYQQQQHQQLNYQINQHLEQQKQQRIELERNKPINTTTRCYPISHGQIKCESTTW